MKRIYQYVIEEHLKSYDQMLFIAGPRQVGKTTIATSAKTLFQHTKFLNWDKLKDREQIVSDTSLLQGLPLDALLKTKPLIIFDEIHKYSKWKTFLKGLIDEYKTKLNIIVTGSCKLDVYRKGGDSLMGRYLLYNIHPISVAELLRTSITNEPISMPKEISDDLYEALLEFGGFPEPFIKQNKRFYTRWKNLRYQQMLKEDIRDSSQIHEISQLELLSHILEYQSAQLLNYSSLSKKIRVSDQTIKRWIELLKAYYYCFTITPWYTNISRSLLKEPKIYLWDWSIVEDKGKKIENFIACHLLKAVNFWSEEHVMINDEIVKVKVAHFMLCYSRKRFVRIYPNEKQEMVFDAHIKAFEYMGGSPKRGIYDNMKTAVQKVLRGKEREWNKKFEQLCAHYMVEPTACTPARGNEKGRVERQVAVDRQQFFTPMPKGKSMEEINDQLMSGFIKYNNTHKHPEYKDQTIEEVYQKEKDGLVSAPILFDGHKESYLKVSTTCLVRYDRNSYSVNCSCAGEIVECKAYADILIFIYEGKEVGVHTRKFSKGGTYYDPKHYLPLLKIKPGALRNGAPFNGLELPQELCEVRELLEEKKNGARDFAQILSYIPVESMEAVVIACKEALKGGIITKDIILNIEVTPSRQTKIDLKRETIYT